MKRLYNFSKAILVAATLWFLPSTSTAQCDVWFQTYTYLCDLDSVILQAIPEEGQAPFSYIWETGETTQQIIIPNALGDYMLTMTDANGCTAIINCHVKLWPDIVFYPWTEYACEGEEIVLYLDWVREELPGLQYLWSTGATTSQITATENMVWSVTVTDPATGCQFVSQPQTLEFDERPDPQIVGPTEICDGQTITLTVEGGPFGYLEWHPNYEYEETIEVTEPGLYWVYASNLTNTWCAGTDTIIITEGEIDEPVLDGPPDLCDSQTGTISVTNHTLFEEFLWSNGETGFSFVAEEPGTYTVTVTDAGGCTASESITIENADENILSVQVTEATCGLSNGGITLSYSIAGSYTFEWSNGATTQNLSNVPSGVYSVTVTNPEGCYSTIETEIPEVEIPIIVNENITPNTSCSEFNGEINLFISPEQTYSITWSNGQTTEDITDLASGNYTVTVSLGTTCSTTETYFVDNLSAAPDLSSTVVPATCGIANGSIDLQLTGGTGPFIYDWSNGEIEEDLIDISGGTYSVTVTAADGCINYLQITVPETDSPIAIAGSVSNNSSCTSPNGSIDITLNPENSNYSYLWSTGSTSEDVSGLGAGIYIVEVTLAGCVSSDTFTVTNESLPFNVTGTSSPNTSCTSANGSINIAISPAGTYSYAWSNGSSNEDLHNLSAGLYSVTVTNTSGCSISSTFTVVEQASPFDVSALSLANTSCTTPNGAINISVSPGSALYTYQWSTGNITEDISNVGPGLYSVTVTNPDGCTIDTSFTVLDQSAPFMIDGVTSPNTACLNSTGSIDLTVTPAAVYSFTWSNGLTTEDISGLGAGSYEVTVSDLSTTCSSVAVFSIEDQVILPSITASLTHETCGEINGEINLTVTPSGSNISWSTGATTEDISGLASGMYSLTVTDPSGCTITDTFTILNNSNTFAVIATLTENTSCLQPNGTIDLNITPSGTYSFVWSNGSTSEDLSDLDEGYYSVTVVDQTNCSANATFFIQDNTAAPVVNAAVTPETCGQGNGGITLTLDPPGGNTFLWSNGAVTQDLEGINSGTYAVTVTSVNGCSAFTEYLVPDNSTDVAIDATVTNNKSCVAGDGAIALEINPAGSYTYMWSNGATSPALQALDAGNYSVTVTDQFNCEFSETFTVASDTLLPVITSNVQPAFCGQSNGGIDIQILLTDNNSFMWSNNEDDEDLHLIAPGEYSVTVTSEEGCTAVAIIEVPNQNSNFSIQSVVTENTSCLTGQGIIDLTVSPAGIYQFEWSNGATSEDLYAITSGIFGVTVTDELNCSSFAEFVMEDLASPPLITYEVKAALCGNTSGKIDLQVMPDTSHYVYAWSDGSDVEDREGLYQGTYNVTVTDANGCSVSSNIDVPGTGPLELNIGADLMSVPIGGTILCSLQLNVQAEAIDSVFWFPQHMLSCHDPVCLEQLLTLTEATEISVIVVDTNGCTGQAQLMLRVESDVDIYVPNVFTPNGDGMNDKFTLYSNNDVEIVTLEIFDRWGNCVFINNEFPSNDPEYGWDGIYSNQPMNPDVFAFRAVVREPSGEQYAYKGDVTLVR